MNRRRTRKIRLITALLLCSALICGLLTPWLTARADDTTEETKHGSLTDIHWYELAHSQDTGYETTHEELLQYRDNAEDQDCVVSSGAFYDYYAKQGDNASILTSISREKFIADYNIYLVYYAGEETNFYGVQNSLQAFLVCRKDYKVCLNTDNRFIYFCTYLQGANDYYSRDGLSDEEFNYQIFDIATGITNNGKYNLNDKGQNGKSVVTVIAGNNCGYADILSPGVKANLAYTNMPVVSSTSDVKKYFTGDDSVISNKSSSGSTTKGGEGCDSFYLDAFDCSLTVDGSSTLSSGNTDYRFAATYSYDTCSKIVASPDDYVIRYRFSFHVAYKLKSHLINEKTYNLAEFEGNIGDYPKTYNKMLSSVSVEDFSSNSSNFGEFMNSASMGFEGVAYLLGLDAGDIVELTDNSIYCTVILNKLGSSKSSGASSDVYFYKWDASSLTKTDLTPSLNVTTTGEGNDKKVSQVVGNDNGQTIVNVTVDVDASGGDGGAGGSGGTGGTGGDGGTGGTGGDGGTGGTGGDGGTGGTGGDGGTGGTGGSGGSGSGGSGSGSDDDDGGSGFWKYVTGIVAFFTALINADSGLFSVIAAFFDFIPAEFWSVVIGAVVIVAIMSIYRLAKKS